LILEWNSTSWQGEYVCDGVLVLRHSKFKVKISKKKTSCIGVGGQRDVCSNCYAKINAKNVKNATKKK